MRGYAEAYVYDVVGNILSMQHAAAGGNWTRRYQYAANGNRLQATSLPGDAAGQHSATYGYDAHGNMSSMPHLSAVGWNYADQMRSADLGGGGTVYFVYDAAGQRVRKVSVNQAGTQSTERIYLGAYEMYRERTNGAPQLERETLHIADDSGRMCDVETRTVESGSAVASPTTHHRYQYSNHLGSASLELTGSAEVISYEEYHPYGTSSYRAVNSSIDVSERTYRYTGKERDEETGLGYHGARYYACWLGRWTASDPIGLGDGVNRYAYVSGRPISLSDPSGTAGETRVLTTHDPASKTQVLERGANGEFALRDFTPGEIKKGRAEVQRSNAAKSKEIQGSLQRPSERYQDNAQREPRLRERIKKGLPLHPAVGDGKSRGRPENTDADGNYSPYLQAVAANEIANGVHPQMSSGPAGHLTEGIVQDGGEVGDKVAGVFFGAAMMKGGFLRKAPRPRPISAAGEIEVPRPTQGDFAGEASAAVAKNKPKVRVGAPVEASAAGGERMLCSRT